MKLLTATTSTQGLRPGDFAFCVEGELVMPPMLFCETDALADDPEVGGCGCGRAFGGLSSRKGTTTAEIREVDMDLDAYVLAIRDCLARQGWDRDATLARTIADQLSEFAAEHKTGTVFRSWLGKLYVI